jgi:hypothetical protein
MPNINVATVNGSKLTLWNVDNRVGRGGPGISINNTLVQYLLFRNNLGSAEELLLSREQVNGVWDPRSQSALKRYESLEGDNVTADGVVDRMRPGQVAGSLSHKRYKMMLLNIGFVRSITGMQTSRAVDAGLLTIDDISDILMRMPETEDVPKDLRFELQTVRDAGGFAR